VIELWMVRVVNQQSKKRRVGDWSEVDKRVTEVIK